MLLRLLQARALPVAVTIAALLVPSLASAQVCEEASETQVALHYLRKLSLDLRGALPTLEESQAVIDAGGLDDSMIDAMLASDDFLHQVRQYHRDLLWSNLSRQRLANFAWQLASPSGRRTAPAYWMPSQARAGRYRGSQVSCLDQPAEFDGEGNIVTYPDEENPQIRREGWVQVSPYWNMSTTVRVCAFDAQDAETVTNPRNPDGPSVDCSKTLNNVSCGCGPNLRYCQVGTTSRAITDSMSEQMMRLIETIVRDDRPYTDVLLAKDAELNGPLSHYLQFQTATGGFNFLSSQNQNHDVPEIDFAELDEWVTVERGERHSGILTLAGYVVRFQTDRARANRFYNAFLCDYFEAPEGGLPPASDTCNDEPDLSKRCGCMHCHYTLEPAASYWGRWTEAGLSALNEDLFPVTRPECVGSQANRNPVCRIYYLTEAGHPDEEPYVGTFRPYIFADAEREARITQGPEGIALDAIDSGRFAECTVSKIWGSLMYRELNETEVGLRDQLIADFIASNYNLRELVRSVVTLDEYRQGQRFGVEK
jgi:hypothetical protein